MFEKRLQTLMLFAIVVLVAGGLLHQNGWFSAKDSSSADKAIADAQKKIEELRSKEKQSAVAAESRRNSISQEAQEFARLRGRASAFSNLCFDYNLSQTGLIASDKENSDLLSSTNRAVFNERVSRESLKLMGMNRNLKDDERSQLCQRAWSEYGPTGTAIPNLLIQK